MRNNFAPRRMGAMILLLLLMAGGIWWVWGRSPQDDGTLAQIKRRGRLRVGLDASFPPFEQIDGQGRIVGLDVDIAREIATDLGVEAEFVNIGFDGLYDALLARRVDIVISGLPYDPRRTEDVAYTSPYFNAGQVVVTDRSIQEVADLAGRTVAVEWGSQADMEARRLAEELPGLTLQREATAAEAIAAVRQERTEAAIVDGVSGQSSGLQIVAYLTDEWYVAAVHIESRALLEAVNQSLARLEQSGQMDRLQKRWLSP